MPGGRRSKASPRCFAARAYQVVAAKPGFGYNCYEASTNFSNFALQVLVTFVQHTSSQDIGGIVFRADVSSNYPNEYYLDFKANGHYVLGICAGTDCSRVVFQGTCTICHFGTAQPDVFAIVANGKSLAFYVNGQKLASGTSSTYSTGLIGFEGYAYTSQAITAYQDLKIWQW